MEIAVILTALMAAAALLLSFTNHRAQEDFQDEVFDILASIGDAFAQAQKVDEDLREGVDGLIERLDSHDERIEDIRKKYDALPMDVIHARAEAEQRWNDGVQEIINYDLNTARNAGE